MQRKVCSVVVAECFSFFFSFSYCSVDRVIVKAFDWLTRKAAKIESTYWSSVYGSLASFFFLQFYAGHGSSSIEKPSLKRIKLHYLLYSRPFIFFFPSDQIHSRSQLYRSKCTCVCKHIDNWKSITKRRKRRQRSTRAAGWTFVVKGQELGLAQCWRVHLRVSPASQTLERVTQRPKRRVSNLIIEINDIFVRYPLSW